MPRSPSTGSAIARRMQGHEGREIASHFAPLQRPTRVRIALLSVVGPLLWIIALAIVGVTEGVGEATGAAMVITIASFVISLGTLVVARIRRARREATR